MSHYLQPLALNDYVIKDTLTFAEIIKSNVLDPNEEYVSYDVESLFANIPVKETFWNSQIPKWYKWNNIQDELHCAFETASDFDAEFQINTWKYN